MLGRLVLISVLVAASFTAAVASMPNDGQNPYSLVTNRFATIRRGPGTNWAAIGVIPPRATFMHVDNCDTGSFSGWCEVTYKGKTGFVHSSLLHVRLHEVSLSEVRRPAIRSDKFISKPAFLQRAEEAARRADNSVTVAEANINRLVRQEALQSRIAMAQTGSWIEPAHLWREKLAAQQKLAYQQELARLAHERLVTAQDRARALWEEKWSESHQPSWFASWWQW
jgi:uncharacterized protein YraI